MYSKKYSVSLYNNGSSHSSQGLSLARSFHSLKPPGSQRKARIRVKSTDILPLKQSHFTAEDAEIAEEDKNRVTKATYC